ncbi:MAG: hypothetical protein D6706_21770 [Chloroflexi bacterium]|nr:MAG: hypothetical protein D6706_21770 [Chloroflexota bacterium]
MSLLEQFIQLLSVWPGNMLYHLITLFALQVVFAISWSHWRRDRTDQVARRMAVAAGVVFLARLGVMVAGLVLRADVARATAVLPPLEQLSHTITAVFLAYALIPHPRRQPYLGDTIAAITTIILIVMYLFFAQSWPPQAAAGIPYNGSPQATVWGIIQLLILVTGLALLSTRRRYWFSLPQGMMALFLLAHAAHFWNYPDLAAPDLNVAYWIRLGHLVVLPLWAVQAYRHTLTAVLRHAHRPAAAITAVMNQTANVIASLSLDSVLRAGIMLAEQQLHPAFTAVGVRDEENPDILHLTSNLPQVGTNQPRTWMINLNDWPAFRLAITRQETVQLHPNGLGARQLYAWYQEMGTPAFGALMAQPLTGRTEPVGILLLAAPEDQVSWPDSAQQQAQAMGRLLGQAIENAQIHAHVLAASSSAPPPPPPSEPDTAMKGRLIALEEEREHLIAQLEKANLRLQQAEERARAANKRALSLAATIEELEKQRGDARIAELEAEIEALHEALAEAEEAMAMAAASENKLSTEWVMQTITRYSGQLEEAQARIMQLESELERRKTGPIDAVIVSLVQELRQPMTSIAGYTDLLLGETMGILGTKQRDFLQRVKANIERMGALLNQIVQLTTGVKVDTTVLATEADVLSAVESAVSAVMTQLREKNLQLELDIRHDLPPVPIPPPILDQILVNLLNNACLSSQENGRILVRAYADNLPPPHQNGRFEPVSFCHLTITDNGTGIAPEDISRVFTPQYQATDPLIKGVGDTGAGLALVRQLTEAHGGRVWVESEPGQGSTFSLIFPLHTNEQSEEHPEQETEA